MSKKKVQNTNKKMKECWLTPIPQNVETVNMTVSFKIDEKDVGKPANEVIRINENSMVSFLSTNSFYNGLILSKFPTAG